jgi:transcriptional regulator NrdR family protein
MKPCPKCHSTSHVLDSRQNNEHTYRRRHCNKCSHAWTTYEIHGDEFDKVQKYNHLKTILSEHLQ